MKTLKKTAHKLLGRAAVKIGFLASFLVLLAISMGLGSGCGKKNNQVILSPKESDHGDNNNNNNNTGELDKGPFEEIQIKPSATNPAITYWDSVHVVRYNPKIENNKILLWLAGTSGLAKGMPKDFSNTALERKYRIISLSYLTLPPGTQICAGANLYATCYEDFRQVRIYGDKSLSTIPDQPHDAIIPRLVKLLQYLNATDPDGKWSNYLDGDKPRWDKICIAGQSMGGGMGLYIAKKENVYKVISFSGGWDIKTRTPTKVIADWYWWPGVTTGSRLYGLYHVQESEAATLAQLYPACGIPESQIYRLSRVLRPNAGGNNPYHGEGIANTAYKPIWETALGFGI